MTQDVRLEQLTQWVHTLPGWEQAVLNPASADASFRRYFRATTPQQSAIVMDAPPDKEALAPFIDTTERLRLAGTHAPAIHHQNLQEGFLLMEDLGKTSLLQVLNPDTVDDYYQNALQALLKLQRAETHKLPVYNEELLRQELDLMPEWFLRTHLRMTPEATSRTLLETTFDQLTEAVLSQPMTFVHRDYHARNLMVPGHGTLGIIDHQDAVLGPATYDLVSLLRDCYVVWPQHQVEDWALRFHKQAIASGNIPPVDEASFMRWFDLTGLQRHLKVLGIFSRLYHRDGKSQYLNDLPLVLAYVLTVGARHPETAALVAWMNNTGIAEQIGPVAIPA